MKVRFLKDAALPGVTARVGEVHEVGPELISAVLSRGLGVAEEARTLDEGRSLRTVLFGDSMGSQHYVDTTPGASYDPATGYVTLTSLSNPIAEGWDGMIFNRTYADLKKHRNVLFEFISSTSVKCFVGKDLPSLPNGALSGTTFLRIPTKVGSNTPFTWVQSELGWRFNVVYNGAQSGDTTQDCLDRIQEHCSAHNPEVVWTQMPGINDMSTGNGPVDEETIAANQRRIIDLLEASGAIVIVLATTPTATGEARSTLQNMARVVQLNRRLGEYCKTKRRVYWFNSSYAGIINPTDTTGLALATLLKSTDAIHYAMPGGMKVCDLIKSDVRALFPGDYDRRPQSTMDSFLNSSVTASSVTIADGVATFNSTAHGFLVGERPLINGATPAELNGIKTILARDANSFSFRTLSSGAVTGTVRAARSRNLFNNPVFATATGGSVSAGVTGTAASLLAVKNCSGSAGGLTAVASVVAHSKYGNAQQLVCSAASADDRPGFEATPTSLLNAYLVAGRSYVLEAELSIASANWANTPASELMARFMVNVDSVLFSSFVFNTYDGLPAAGAFTVDRDVHIRTHPFKVPAGTISQGYFQIYLRAAGTWSSNVTLKLSRLAVFDVTEMDS